MLFINIFLLLSNAFALERFDIVTTETLKNMLDQRERGDSQFLLINTLDKMIADHFTIPGSINIPWSKVRNQAQLLGKDKSIPIITYCMGYRWVFSYKTAVAVKELGFSQVKIYNGGIKDWQKSGFELERRAPLPQIPVDFVDTDFFYGTLQKNNSVKCLDDEGKPLLTLLDFRNGNHIQSEKKPPQIPTSCPTQQLLLDDLLDEQNRMSIPDTHMVITITETGNRDEFAIRFLTQFGYTNIKGLRFGMRGWLKQRYPIK